MRESRLKAKMARGEPVVGTMIGELPVADAVRAMAVGGFDFLVVDNEHAPVPLETDLALYREAGAAGIDMLVRVPDAAYHLIARTLDAGADGIMVPRVETEAQARVVVESAKYPPVGRRGCGQRPVYTGLEAVPLADYVDHLNRNTTVMIQVESGLALENLDAMLAVGGIDIALIGPADLSISLGVPGQVDHPRMWEAINRVVDCCRRAGVYAGIHWGDPTFLTQAHGAGMQAIMYLTDAAMLAAAAKRARGELAF